MTIQRQTVAPPQAPLLFTMRYPLGAIAVDIVLFPLNKLDKIRLFHPKWVNSHAFGHPLNLLKSHFTLLCVVF